jgi:hypothetical protein
VGGSFETAAQFLANTTVNMQVRETGELIIVFTLQPTKLIHCLTVVAKEGEVVVGLKVKEGIQ